MDLEHHRLIRQSVVLAAGLVPLDLVDFHFDFRYLPQLRVSYNLNKMGIESQLILVPYIQR